MIVTRTNQCSQYSYRIELLSVLFSVMLQYGWLDQIQARLIEYVPIIVLVLLSINKRGLTEIVRAIV